MKELFDKVKAKLKGLGVWVIFIIVIAVVAIPYIALLITLRKQNKTITLKPTLAVVDIQNSNKVDMDIAKDAIDSGKALLEKLNTITSNKNVQ